ncbi:hypothetical protein GCM10011363_40470 [Marivita lacus]|uniref:Uncharacterized protein n=1 Tax=Marivita lacus TaxID=1323742 RepID=A0ABQ1L7C4_9RHOB|nr:hypothetical protein [Marivita lacus]GGC19681.1 hypothetical protein GCM10011363_40470 [Marivita lacus]
MSKFAKVVNDTVIEVLDTLEGRIHPALHGEYIQVPDAVEPGFVKTGRKFEAPAPVAAVAPPPPEPITVVSRLDFLRRFTRTERIALRAAETTDPVVADFLLMLTLAEDVDLTSADVTEGLAYLEANGFVTAERGAAIRSG